MEVLLQWKLGCTAHANPEWEVQRVIQYVYGLWPLDIGYNPLYLERTLGTYLKLIGNFGADRGFEVWGDLYGTKANLECEARIDEVMDEEHWKTQRYSK